MDEIIQIVEVAHSVPRICGTNRRADCGTDMSQAKRIMKQIMATSGRSRTSRIQNHATVHIKIPQVSDIPVVDADCSEVHRDSSVAVL